MPDGVSLAVVFAIVLLMEFGIESRFGLKRKIMRRTVLRRWPERRFWWPGALFLVTGMIALAAALDAVLLPFWPELGDIAGYRYGKIALLVALIMPMRHDWIGRDEPGEGCNEA